MIITPRVVAKAANGGSSSHKSGSDGRARRARLGERVSEWAAAANRRASRAMSDKQSSGPNPTGYRSSYERTVGGWVGVGRVGGANGRVSRSKEGIMKAH